MKVTIISGPVGAGKTTVAKELIGLLPAPVSYIEGDTFWSFVSRAHSPDRRAVFQVIMRAMAAAAIPFARTGYQVVLDFSMPPYFLDTVRKILKEVPFDYVVLRPSVEVCEARAAARPEGKISNYADYREFYTLFEGSSSYIVSDDKADAGALAKLICEGLGTGRFSLP
jgi:adenylylsulfate kinase-like enzyme